MEQLTIKHHYEYWITYANETEQGIHCATAYSPDEAKAFLKFYREEDEGNCVYSCHKVSVNRTAEKQDW